MRSIFKPKFESQPLLYDIITGVVTSICVNYVATPFGLLSWSASVQFMKSFYFLPHVIPAAIFVALSLFDRSSKQHQQQNKRRKEQQPQ
jgi:hypothetical protein